MGGLAGLAVAGLAAREQRRGVRPGHLVPDGRDVDGRSPLRVRPDADVQRGDQGAQRRVAVPRRQAARRVAGACRRGGRQLDAVIVAPPQPRQVNAREDGRGRAGRARRGR